MDDLSYLIFVVNQVCYGVPTTAVQEIFFIPEITPLVEATTDILGIIDLRGEILPIVSLHQKLGQPIPPCQLTDSVIVLRWRQDCVGIVVNQVNEVQEITPEQLKTNFSENLASESNPNALVAGIASVDDTLITLLNPQRLLSGLRLSEWVATAEPLLSSTNGHSANATIAGRQAEDWYAHLSIEARQTLQARSRNLRSTTNNQNAEGFLPLAVMGLADEYFGIPLDMVDEFTDIRKLTPIPCCPSHILGNMNLRGEIVTVIDISQILNLVSHPDGERQKAIVVRINELSVGIAVDDIFDVAYVDPGQISAIPVAIHSVHDEYLQGVSAYQEKMMSIINLPKVVMADSLVVNEEI